MKKITLLLCCLFSAFWIFSQDTLVNDQGTAFPVKIIALDSASITYASSDTSIKELTITPKSKNILVKYSNGRIDRFFKNDTITTKEGGFISCKILAIEPGLVTYYPNIGGITTPIMFPTSQIFYIQFQNGTREYMLTDLEYGVLGKQDAKLYFKPKGGFIAGEFFLGFSSLLVLPIIAVTSNPALASLIVVPIIAGTAKAYAPISDSNLDNLANPNNELLTKAPTYQKEFKKQATKKKRITGSVSFLSGILGSIGGFFMFLLFTGWI